MCMTTDHEHNASRVLQPICDHCRPRYCTARKPSYSNYGAGCRETMTIRLEQDVGEHLRFLGKRCTRKEAVDIVWEVDENLDQAIDW